MRNLIILLLVMIIDIVTGMIKSAVNSKNIKSMKWLSSSKATKGFLQKIAVLLSLAVCKLLTMNTIAADSVILSNIYVVFYAYAMMNECISVFENLTKTDSRYKDFETEIKKKLEGGGTNEGNGKSDKENKKES